LNFGADGEVVALWGSVFEFCEDGIDFCKVICFDFSETIF
jgi:hypothetical protein